MDMDIYEYLKMDHKKVSKLFELFKTAPTERNKIETFEMIEKELTVHADAEANTFYKALEAHQKSEDEAWHGEDEHNEIKAKLAEISSNKHNRAVMERMVLELKELVDHHVSDEEGKIFRVAKKVLSEEEACILKLQMHDYKEKILNAIPAKEKLKEKIE